MHLGDALISTAVGGTFWALRLCPRTLVLHRGHRRADTHGQSKQMIHHEDRKTTNPAIETDPVSFAFFRAFHVQALS